MNLPALITSELVDIQMHSPIINKTRAFNIMNLDIKSSFNRRVILYPTVIRYIENESIFIVPIYITYMHWKEPDAGCKLKLYSYTYQIYALETKMPDLWEKQNLNISHPFDTDTHWTNTLNTT